MEIFHHHDFIAAADTKFNKEKKKEISQVNKTVKSIMTVARYTFVVVAKNNNQNIAKLYIIEFECGIRKMRY